VTISIIASETARVDATVGSDHLPIGPTWSDLRPVRNNMRLSSLADYAVVMMTAIARHCGGIARVNATLLAGETGVPLPTAQKLVSRLSAAGLLDSSRGTGGGVRLSRPPASISLADIVEAVDGPITLTGCDHETVPCQLDGRCQVKPHWPIVNAAVRDALAAVTLSRLAAAPVPVATPRPEVFA